MKTSRTRLSYILKNDYSDPTHTLGINALAIHSPNDDSIANKSHSILYTAGKDGKINSWDITSKHPSSSTVNYGSGILSRHGSNNSLSGALGKQSRGQPDSQIEVQPSNFNLPLDDNTFE
jgi:hypothetical protein